MDRRHLFSLRPGAVASAERLTKFWVRYNPEGYCDFYECDLYDLVKR